MSQPGRPRNLCIYSYVDHNGKKYTVVTIVHKGNPVKFLIDQEERHKIEEYSWHVTAYAYISTTIYLDGVKKAVYLHNVILNRGLFGGKGQLETVDHINRNGFDNRKENLRVATQTAQNINQRQLSRDVELPADCGVMPDDIPRHIWYVRANGAHGDRFAIEFKSENLVWKSTSSKKISTCDKLDEAVAKLQELYAEFPHLNPSNPEIIEKVKTLSNSFKEIITLS